MPLNLPHPPVTYTRDWMNQYTRVLELEDLFIWTAIQGVTNVLTIAPGGSLTTVGAYAITLTATGTTSITLPTAGTLATLAGVETLTNKTFVAPALGTPASGVATNLTGTAAGLTAGTVTTNANLTGMVTSVGNAATVVTNANLTGPITSVGNATAVAAQTGTGSTFVMSAAPTMTTPALTAQTVATLPAGTAGMMSYVTDGDAALAWGATVVNSGAGATPYLCWYNGTNWTVAGK